MSPLAFRAPSHFDPVLLSLSLSLVVLGTIMVGSSSIAIADRDTGEPLYFLFQHLAALAIGLTGAGCAVLIPTEVWYRLNGLLLFAGLGLLAAVLVPGVGDTVNGSTRWIEFGPLRVQASEPGRLFLLMYLASYAVRQHSDLSSGLFGFLKPMLIVVLAVVLLLAEPDFGAAVVLTATALGILFAAGARLRDVSLAFGAAGLAFGVLALSAAYRIERIMTFRNPWEDPFDTGFQLVQSLIAIGRGDWFGVGLGASVQKLFYLPEGHTDFVFAVLAEELGLLGATLVIGLFAAVVFRALTLANRAFNVALPFQGLLSIGIGLMLGLQAIINIGVNTGLLPTKGLTLPLISYGRSSTVVTLVALGLLARIFHEVRHAEQKPVRRSSRS
jgi:cell division protein FtsW